MEQQGKGGPRRQKTPGARAAEAGRRRQKEILRKKALRRYYMVLAAMGVAALGVLVGLGFAVRALVLHLRGGAPSSISAVSVSQTVSVPASSSEPAADPNAPADPSLWSLILVNTTNPLPEGYEPALASVGSNSRNGEQYMDERAAQPLADMFAAAEADGITLIPRSAYRSTQEQATLFNSMLQSYMDQGLTQEQAFAETKKWRNEPGTSEHESGLSVDIVGEGYINASLEAGLADTDWAKWLLENAADYGFILRYPKDKTDITGTSFEPWHYRYVGVEDAQKIMAQGVCLEEYLGAA